MVSDVSHVLATVGISFFSFLSPKELACLSLASKHFHSETHKHIFNVCMLQLPISSGAGSGDTLDCAASSPNTKTDFLNNVVGLLKSRGIAVDGDISGDQGELLNKCSFVKLIADDGSGAHFALGFKSRAFKSKHLVLVHAKKFTEEWYFRENTEQRLVAKQWMYLLASLKDVTVGTWFAIFVLREETELHTRTNPVGGAGVLYTNEHGEVIEFVRKMWLRA